MVVDTRGIVECFRTDDGVGRMCLRERQDIFNQRVALRLEAGLVGGADGDEVEEMAVGLGEGVGTDAVEESAGSRGVGLGEGAGTHHARVGEHFLLLPAGGEQEQKERGEEREGRGEPQPPTPSADEEGGGD